MITWLAASAMAQHVELGVGRAAVLEPGVAPTAITLSNGDVVEVVPVQPAIVLLGRKAGETTLTLEHARGSLEWTVTVQPTGDVAPSGVLVAPPGEVLALAAGEAAWCRIRGTTAMTFLDQDVGSVSPIGVDRSLVQASGVGVTDLVFETASGPKVLTVSVSATGSAQLPAACHRPTETITLAVGEERIVPVGRTVGAIDVGHPGVVSGGHVPEKPSTLRLVGLAAGTSILLVRSSDNEDPWARNVVVAPPQ